MKHKSICLTTFFIYVAFVIFSSPHSHARKILFHLIQFPSLLTFELFFLIKANASAREKCKITFLFFLPRNYSSMYAENLHMEFNSRKRVFHSFFPLSLSTVDICFHLVCISYFRRGTFWQSNKIGIEKITFEVNFSKTLPKKYFWNCQILIILASLPCLCI